MNARPNVCLPTWVILQYEPLSPTGAEVRVVQNGGLIGNDRWQQLEPQGPLMIQAALGSERAPSLPVKGI